MSFNDDASKIRRDFPHDTNLSQLDKFKQAARDLGADESEQRFNEALGKIARQKPKPDKPPEKAPETEDKKPAK